MIRADKQLNHLQYIDSLRGLAFLSVLTVHVGEATSFTAHGLTSAGQFGVQLFFLLSAITLLRSLHLRSRAEARPTVNFYIRRIFRIGPLFWLAIVAYFFIDGSRPQFFAPDGIHIWQYLLTFFFAHGWTPTSINSVVPGGWSIAVEMNFYLILPLIWKRIPSITQADKWILLTLLANTVLAQFTVHVLAKHYRADHLYLLAPFVSWWFPAQISVFLLGFLIFNIVQNQSTMQSLRGSSSAYVLIAASAYLLAKFAEINASAILFSVAWGLLIVGLASKPVAFLVNPISGYVGKVSFSCYLTHFAMLTVAEALLHRLGCDRLQHPAFFACLWLSTLILTVLVSTLTYRLVERPGIRLGDILIGKIEAGTLPQTT